MLFTSPFIEHRLVFLSGPELPHIPSPESDASRNPTGVPKATKDTRGATNPDRIAASKTKADRASAEADEIRAESDQVRNLEQKMNPSAPSDRSRNPDSRGREVLSPNVIDLLGRVVAASVAYEKWRTTGEEIAEPMGGGIALRQLEVEYQTLTPGQQAIVRNEITRQFVLTGLRVTAQDRNGTLALVRDQ